jgi:hypothetical protein
MEPESGKAQEDRRSFLPMLHLTEVARKTLELVSAILVRRPVGGEVNWGRFRLDYM